MFLRKPFAASPLFVRVAPFVIFLALTFCQGQFGEASRYWFYLAKTLAGAWLIWEMRPFVSEMRWAMSWEAVVVGLGVFAVWVGISGEWTTQNSLWAKLGLSHPPAAPPKLWNPNEQFGGGSALAWLDDCRRELSARPSSCRRWRRFFTARFCIATSPGRIFCPCR